MEIKPEIRAVVAKSIAHGHEKLEYGIRREPENENESGWLFLSYAESRIKNPRQDQFDSYSYNEVIEKCQPLLKYIYRLPVGSQIKFVEYGNRVYIVDMKTNKTIDYLKYDSLPDGTPLSEALVPKSGAFRRLLGSFGFGG